MKYYGGPEHHIGICELCNLEEGDCKCCVQCGDFADNSSDEGPICDGCVEKIIDDMEVSK